MDKLQRCSMAIATHCNTRQQHDIIKTDDLIVDLDFEYM